MPVNFGLGSKVTAQELKATGQRLFEANQYTEALPLLKSAAETLPEDEYLWQKLVWSASQTGQRGQAVEFAKQGLRHHPRSAWLWGQLGCDLSENESLDEAEKALNHAVSFNPNAEWLWRYLASLQRKRRNLEKEIDALKSLCSLRTANSTNLHQLGIAYYNHKNFAKALEFYLRSLAIKSDVAPLFNMGLVFNDQEVARKADAAVAYR